MVRRETCLQPPARRCLSSSRRAPRPGSLRITPRSARAGGVILIAGLIASSVLGGESQPGVLRREIVSPVGRPRGVDKGGKWQEDQRAALSLVETPSRGGVPVLPHNPYRYARVELPDHVDASYFRQVDNTPADNPLTDRGATLGRVLFYDKHLSHNDTVSCATCHVQKAAFADPRQFSVGFQGGRTKRNAMSLANLRYTRLKGAQPGFFWDERAATLEAQVLMPIQDTLEMGMTLDDLEAKLAKLRYYPPLFADAFGSQEVTRERIAKALAQWLRSMVSLDSKFDRAAAAHAAADKAPGPFDDFSDQENLGKALFMQGIGGIAEFSCAHCHTPPTFNMEKAFNIGLDLDYKDAGLGALDRPPNDPFTPSNDGKFKAPSLRNIALTAPYMHDGRFKTLEEVVDHYSDRVHPHENLELAFEESPTEGATSGFRFSDDQKAAIVAFLKTLTDERYVSDPRFSDPFVRAKP